MPEMHSELTCSACRSFTTNKERMQKFEEAGDSRYIYKNELLSAWHGSWNFKGLSRRAASDKVLCDKVFNIAKIGYTMDISADVF